MDLISPYIDSDKKLHIRFEKLLSLLLSCGFSGRIEVLSSGTPFFIIVSKGSVFTDKPLNLLGNLPKETLFKVESSFDDGMKKGLKEYDGQEFLFSVILNMPRERVLDVLKPYATEFISIRPETSKLMFLYEDLAPFIGQQKIEIFSNLKKSYRTIYFLLISQNAAILPSDAEPDNDGGFLFEIWDGTFHGDVVNDGVYFINVEAVGAGGRKFDKKADINVLKGLGVGN